MWYVVVCSFDKQIEFCTLFIGLEYHLNWHLFWQHDKLLDTQRGPFVLHMKTVVMFRNTRGAFFYIALQHGHSLNYWTVLLCKRSGHLGELSLLETWSKLSNLH